MLRLFLILSAFAAAEAKAAGCNDTMLSITDWSVRRADTSNVEINLRVHSHATKQIRMVRGLAYFTTHWTSRSGLFQ